MEVKQAITRCRAGDKAAYETVVRTYAGPIVGILQKILGNLEEARDVAQETFVRAYLNLHRYDPRRPFEPWLYRIGRNLAYNRLKALGRRGETISEPGREWAFEEIPGETKSPVEGVLDKERQQNIQEVLGCMRPEFQEVLTLRYMAKLEYEEIAARMSIPKGTVKCWLNRAKEQFRKHAEVGDFF